MDWHPAAPDFVFLVRLPLFCGCKGEPKEKAAVVGDPLKKTRPYGPYAFTGHGVLFF